MPWLAESRGDRLLPRVLARNDASGEFHQVSVKAGWCSPLLHLVFLICERIADALNVFITRSAYGWLVFATLPNSEAGGKVLGQRKCRSGHRLRRRQGRVCGMVENPPLVDNS